MPTEVSEAREGRGCELKSSSAHASLVVACNLAGLLTEVVARRRV